MHLVQRRRRRLKRFLPHVVRIPHWNLTDRAPNVGSRCFNDFNPSERHDGAEISDRRPVWLVLAEVDAVICIHVWNALDSRMDEFSLCAGAANRPFVNCKSPIGHYGTPCIDKLSPDYSVFPRNRGINLKPSKSMSAKIQEDMSGGIGCNRYRAYRLTSHNRLWRTSLPFKAKGDGRS